MTHVKVAGRQRYDIWFGGTFNFAVEFDEKQHLNQFRKQTLNSYQALPLGTINENYAVYCTWHKKPGTSGFQKLKKPDPLFPELYLGEQQDNRIRQRAFRDYLKDILPLVNGANPTVRIPFQLTHNKIKDFDYDDLDRISKYLSINRFVDFIKIRD